MEEGKIEGSGAIWVQNVSVASNGDTECVCVCVCVCVCLRACVCKEQSPAFYIVKGFALYSVCVCVCVCVREREREREREDKKHKIFKKSSHTLHQQI